MSYMPLFNLGDLRKAIQGMPDSVTFTVEIQGLAVPIDAVTESAQMAGRWPPETVRLMPDAAWLARALAREAK